MKNGKGTNSCPSRRPCSTTSGPWSLKWIGDKNIGNAGVIFSSRKNIKRKDSSVKHHNVTKKKADTVVRHPVVNFKRVARMPIKERKVVLKELKHQRRQRRLRMFSGGGKSTGEAETNSSDTSQISVNNDWQNWVVLHGDKEVVVNVVWGIGKAIRVNFNGDNANMFNVLSHRGRRSDKGGGNSVGEGGNGLEGVVRM